MIVILCNRVYMITALTVLSFSKFHASSIGGDSETQLLNCVSRRDENFSSMHEVLEDKPKIVECDRDNPKCCTVWLSNETGINITYQGCIADLNCIDYDQCVGKLKHRGTHYYCCCSTDMCNQNFTALPKEHNSTEDPQEKENSEPNSDISLSLTLLICFCVFSILCVAAIYFLQKNRKYTSVEVAEQKQLKSTSIKKFPTIELLEEKASGRFGAVWKAKMEDKIIAVKIVPEQDKRTWLTEQKILKLPLMKHTNILQFIGAQICKVNSMREYWLMTAYHERGSLQDYLRNNTLTFEQLHIIALTMTRGLAHLHSDIAPIKGSDKQNFYKPAIAHRDFKSSNVLLNTDLSACIADFGLAVPFNTQNIGTMHTQVGTVRYMAPEVLACSISFIPMSFLRIDIYACALVLWEILSRCTVHEDALNAYELPYEAELTKRDMEPTPENFTELVYLKEIRPQLSKWRSYEMLSYICDTIDEAWDPDPEARISASCITERLSTIAQH